MCNSLTFSTYISIIKIFIMKTEQKKGDFLLRLTPEERKKLKLLATHKNTTMQGLVRYLIQSKKTIDEL